MKKQKRKKKKLVKSVDYQGGEFVTKLPPWAEAKIAETILLHARLEWIQAKTVFNLTEISIKRGRIFYRLPQAGNYMTQLKQHLALSKIKLKNAKLNTYGDELRDAGAARNALAHSVYVRDTKGRIRIQLVTGSWDLDPDVYEPLYRPISPETPTLTRAFLNRKRATVNVALRHALRLHKAVNRALFALQDKRRTTPALDRRNRGQSQNRLLNLQRPPEAPLHIVQAYRRSLGL